MLPLTRLLYPPVGLIHRPPPEVAPPETSLGDMLFVLGHALKRPHTLSPQASLVMASPSMLSLWSSLWFSVWSCPFPGGRAPVGPPSPTRLWHEALP